MDDRVAAEGPLRQLAAELDLLLAGDISRDRLNYLEGSITAAAGLRHLLPSFDDLEEAVASFNPHGGSHYSNEPILMAISRIAREEVGGLLHET